MSLTKITYSDYNGSTAGTYLKKANLASENPTASPTAASTTSISRKWKKL